MQEVEKTKHEGQRRGRRWPKLLRAENRRSREHNKRDIVWKLWPDCRERKVVRRLFQGALYQTCLCFYGLFSIGIGISDLQGGHLGSLANLTNCSGLLWYQLQGFRCCMRSWILFSPFLTWLFHGPFIFLVRMSCNVTCRTFFQTSMKGLGSSNSVDFTILALPLFHGTHVSGEWPIPGASFLKITAGAQLLRFSLFNEECYWLLP